MQQVADWLQKLGMSEYAERFAETSTAKTSVISTPYSSMYCGAPQRKDAGNEGWENYLVLTGTGAVTLIKPPPLSDGGSCCQIARFSESVIDATSNEIDPRFCDGQRFG